MNYSESTTKLFAFFSQLVTAANLPLYLACSLAVLFILKRRNHSSSAPYGRIWSISAFLAAAFCIWAFAGVGTKPWVYAIGLAIAGIPFHLASRVNEVVTYESETL